MSTVTTRLGLVKPAGLEQFSRATYNNNLDALDLAMPRITIADSTVDGSQWNFTGSRFTRIEFGNGNGIVIAYYNGLVDASTTLPANTATGNTISGVTPPGFAPGYTINYSPAIFSGAGIGVECQVAIIGGSGNFLIRSGTTSTYATVIGSAVNFAVAYRWDGVM